MGALDPKGIRSQPDDCQKEVSVPRALDRYMRTFVAALVSCGVRHAVVTPGSRNTPLVLALTDDRSGVHPWVHLDERSAGYFALGLARQLNEPVTIVCTSGTAAANLLPAIVEARLSRVPLIVLTADRPPELRDVGASQTIDQVRMFGNHAKWTVDMPVAGSDVFLDRYAASAAVRASLLAVEVPSGPIHLNFPLREPLMETESSVPAVLPFEINKRQSGRVTLSNQQIDELASEIAGRRGLIIAGPEPLGSPAALVELVRILDWPLIADPLSGVRTGHHDMSRVVDRVDTLVREPIFTNAARPEVVIRFGPTMTSKPFNSWLASLGNVSHFVVDEAALGTAGFRDPELLSGSIVRSNPTLLCEALINAQPRSADSNWNTYWNEANNLVSDSIETAIDALEEPFEGAIPRDLAAVLPDGAVLVVGNSMPVRDVDSFFGKVPRDLEMFGTRGASGIDGVISTAAGAAAVDGPVVLLVGDLSFFHDQNGLWAVKRHELDLTVLLINNNGGGIFEFLPQRGLEDDLFESWFGTPHDLDFLHVVTQYGGRHTVLENNSRKMISEAIETPGLDVLELRTDRTRNVVLHQEIFNAACVKLRDALNNELVPPKVG